jgi:hypothetical protein
MSAPPPIPTSETRMLTPVQRKYLKTLAGYSQTRPDLSSFLRANAARFTLYLTIAALLGWMGLMGTPYPLLNCFLLGFVAGSLVMLFQMFRRSLRLWPVVKQITDWSTVQRLLKEGH